MATEPNRTEIIHDLKNNFNENNILKLKTLFPEAFCENQIDWEKLKLILGEDNLAHQNERYQLNWAGRTDAYRTLQAPTFNTLSPRRAESVDFDGTRNLFIEAENLEALKILQKAYAGSVKMIYIDPPYNTGSDSFIYPDKFSETREEYARRVGDKDADGYLKRDGVFQGAWRKNSKDSGHYHSNWLSMMLPRLHLARTLLRDDGVIFISIDDNEQAQLKLLCDEVFGAENFIAKCIHKNNANKNQSKFIGVSTEYLFIYSKNLFELSAQTENWRIKKEGVKDVARKFKQLKEQGLSLEEIETEIKEMYKRPKYAHLSRWNKVDEQGVFKDADLSRQGGKKDYTIINPNTGKPCIIPRRGWDKSHDDLLKLQKENLIWYGDENTPPSIKSYITEDDFSVPDNFWYFDNSVDTKFIKQIFGELVFENPKSLNMIKRVLELGSHLDCIILDFFAGSGTTAHAVMQLNAEDGGNRRYICVQLPEETDEKSEARKAGFATISEIAKERIRRAGAAVSGSLKDGQRVDTGFKVFKLSESSFKQWRQPENGTDLEQQLRLAIDSVAEHAAPENMVYELMLRLGCKLTSPIEHKNGVYWVTDEDTGKRIALLLEAADQTLIDDVIAAAPTKVVALDKWFDDNDALKSNTVLQMKDAGIVFECV